MEPLAKVCNISLERYLRCAGDLFLYDADYDAALEMVDKSLFLEPWDSRALLLRGDILYCLNRDEEALEAFTKALESDPDNMEGWISRAGVLDMLGRPLEGLECCDEAMIRFKAPDHNYLLPFLYDAMLALLLQLKRYRQAKHLMTRVAKEVLPKDAAFLKMQYAATIDAMLRHRERVTRKAKRLSLTIIPSA